MNDQEGHLLREKACIIWMHGLGADSSDMMGLASELHIPADQFKHVYLDAPIRPVTINNGMMMPAWYDILGVTLFDREDQQGIQASQQILLKAITQEIHAGFTSSQIFLAGFSQGGALALYTGLHYAERLAGLIVLSAYLPLATQVRPIAPKEVPVFVASGRFDPMIQPQWTEMTLEWLEKNGYTHVSQHTYPMPHSICHEEIADLSCWLMTQIEN